MAAHQRSRTNRSDACAQTTKRSTTVRLDEKRRSLKKKIRRSAAALVAALALTGVVASSAQAEFGLEPGSFQLTNTKSQAGAHGDLTTSFAFNRTSPALPDGTVRGMHFTLPAGLVANAQAFPKCEIARTLIGSFQPNQCPLTTVVGMAQIEISSASNQVAEEKTALIYNVKPYNDEPAAFAFGVLGFPIRFDTRVLAGDDYRVGVDVTGREEILILKGSATFWGVPADHIGAEGEGPYTDVSTFRFFGAPDFGATKTPFLSNSTSCSGPQPASMDFDSWQNPGNLLHEETDLAELQGCVNVPFEPSMSVNADSHRAGAPAGYTVDLNVPQIEAPYSGAVSHLKDATVTLPQGTVISPALANGLQGCSTADMQIGTETPASCPPASKIGTVSAQTPLLPGPLTGNVYVGEPLPGNTYRLALSLQGYGVDVKLEGKVTPDPTTGRLTATFLDNPQLPFSNLHLAFKGGPNAALVNPSACGPATTEYQLTAWSGAVVSGSDSFPVDEGCGAPGFSPKLGAGTSNPVAGSFSPFALRVTQASGEQGLSRISATLPTGLLAKLAGVPLCPDAQAAGGDCPASSQVGSAVVGVGAGSNPLYVPEAGKAPTGVYLAGPYKGAPYSLVVKVPAEAGPFNLGTVVVRNALRIDPTTTQVTAESDPLPQILDGIPIAYRDVRVEINRADFTINPTSCEPMQVASSLTSVTGQTASPGSRFQVADCERLAFKPKLSLKFAGQTKRSGNPALTAVLTQPEGQNANVAGAQVILPKTEFIDNSHINGPCTRVQFNANQCPESSILGTATAYSPLLEQPLTGPVYFRSNGGERELPDLVADLNGAIHVTLVGFIDSVKVGKESSRVRTRFQSVPDAPVSKFILKLRGGSRGLLENSQNLCQVKPVAKVTMEGQNGKSSDFQQKIATVCGKGKKSKKGKKS